MKSVSFDITDIVHYALDNRRVSGIQRVQLNIIKHVVQQHPSAEIRCVFFHPRLLRMKSFSASELPKEEFNGDWLLEALDVINLSSRIPRKGKVKYYLRQFDANKLVRTLKKVDVYLSAYAFPNRLRAMGFEAPKPRSNRAPRIALTTIKHLPHDSTYLALGANWSLPQSIVFGRMHSAHGGDVVQLAYDLIPHVHPEYFSKDLVADFHKWLANTTEYATHFICISQWTAKDLNAFLIRQGRHKPVSSVPLAHEFSGFARVTRPPAVDREHSSSQRPFVLCVGTIEIRKNGASLLKAWQRLIPQLGEKTPKLIFAGKEGWLVHEFHRILQEAPRLSAFVELHQSPTDTELAELYQGCLFTVYPSLYEGWGLPVGESAWFGKFCITSNRTSLPEVCGDLVDYVDPEDIGALTAALHKAITQPDYVAEKERVIRHAPLRTWAQVAEDIYAFVQADTAKTSSVATAAVPTAGDDVESSYLA